MSKTGKSLLDFLSSKSEISDFKVTYLDSRKPKKVAIVDNVRDFFKTSAVSSTNVISRAQWGSPDPNGYLFRENQESYWWPNSSPVTQIFIHHTVNADVNADPAAIVRGIWEFHTYTRGWGDIGYNYLVDSNGTVYEGKFGGDTINGGHVYHFNQGSLGVALIGCYQSDSSTCKSLNGNKVPGPSTKMLDGLTSLLAEKATSFEIDPTAQGLFCNSYCLNLWKIAGHRDADATGCPGDLTYADLPYIRNETKRKMGLGGYARLAELLTYDQVSLIGKDSTSVTMKFKNMGTTTWDSNTILKTANFDNRISRFATNTWIDSSTPAKIVETSVPPGGTGTFTFTVQKFSPNDRGIYLEDFRLIFSDGSYTNAFYPLIVNTDFYESANLPNSYSSIYITQGTFFWASARFQNTGNIAWYDDTSYASGPAGTKPVHLGTANPTNHASAFLKKWGNGMNRLATNFYAVYESDGTTLATNQHIVQPGQIARYEFMLEFPLDMAPATYNLYLQPLVEGGSTMGPGYGYVTINATPATFQSAYKSQSAYPTISNDYAPNPVWLEYKNTGNAPWYDDIGLSQAPSGTKPLHLATSHNIGRASELGILWPGDHNRPGLVFAKVYDANGNEYSSNPHVAMPGESIRFAFNFASSVDNLKTYYREFFQPIIEGGTTMNDTWTFLDAYVSTYSAAYFNQCIYPTIHPGQSADCFFMFKNTGNTPWYDDTSYSSGPAGTKPIQLSTDVPINRSSIFGSSWGFDKDRPTGTFFKVYNSDGVTEAVGSHVVQPGQIAMMKFTFTAPAYAANQTYREFFKPIVEVGSTISGGGVFIDVVVD